MDVKTIDDLYEYGAGLQAEFELLSEKQTKAIQKDVTWLCFWIWIQSTLLGFFMWVHL